MNSSDDGSGSLFDPENDGDEEDDDKYEDDDKDKTLSNNDKHPDACKDAVASINPSNRCSNSASVKCARAVGSALAWQK